MAKKLDLKRHFEAILGREFVDLSDGEILLKDFTGLSSMEESDQVRSFYSQTSRDIGTTGDSTKTCAPAKLISVGGLTATDTDGKAEFLLSEHHCFNQIAVKHPIIFVATAQSQDPVFVTTRTFEVATIENLKIPTDVRIEIYTWEPGGAPAKNKLVKWFCQFPGEIILL
jgi:hypothetical protein